MTPEGRVKKAVCEYLQYCQDLFFWVQESQGTFDAKNKTFRKKNSPFQRNGIPDIMILLKAYGLTTWIGFEIKAGKNNQTDSQKTFEADLTNFAGSGHYFVIRSPEEARDAIQKTRVKLKSLLILK